MNLEPTSAPNTTPTTATTLTSIPAIVITPNEIENEADDEGNNQHTNYQIKNKKDKEREHKHRHRTKTEDGHKHRHKTKAEDGHKHKRDKDVAEENTHKHRHKHKHDKDSMEHNDESGTNSEGNNLNPITKHKHHHHHHHHHREDKENNHEHKHHHRHKHSKTEAPQMQLSTTQETADSNKQGGEEISEIHLEIIDNATTEAGKGAEPNTTQLKLTQTTQTLMPSLPPANGSPALSSQNTSTEMISSGVSINPQIERIEELTGDGESSDKPESQPAQPSAASSREFTFMEPPMPVEHKKDRLRHHIKLAHKKNTLGETIYKGHPSWLLMRDIQTGLYNNIKNLATRTVDPGLFHTPPVTVLPIAPAAKFTFKFKDYCPMAFYNLREHFGINHVDYVTSLCQNWNEVGTPGKSGSLFFFSLDNQYVLKTIPKREAKILRGLLPAYYVYMTTHTNSLLTRFMGLHRVKPHKGRQVRFLVMGNLFNSNLRVHMRFDLKGSTVGRELSPAERLKKNPTFKDMDFLRLNRKFHLGPNKDLLLQILREDSDFLAAQHIMDYSLLVGIHVHQVDEKNTSSDEEAEEEGRIEPRTPPLNRSMSTLPPIVPDAEIPPPNQALSHFEREEGGVRARHPDGTPMDEYYYIGVIDILMQYSARKQIEHAAKKLMHPRGEISSVEPSAFAARFMKFSMESVD